MGNAHVKHMMALFSVAPEQVMHLESAVLCAASKIGCLDFLQNQFPDVGIGLLE